MTDSQNRYSMHLRNRAAALISAPSEGPATLGEIARAYVAMSESVSNPNLPISNVVRLTPLDPEAAAPTRTVSPA